MKRQLNALFSRRSEGSIFTAKNFGLLHNLQSQKSKVHFCDTSDQPSLNWLSGQSFTHWSETLMKREFLVRIQKQAPTCNVQEHLDVALRDRLVAGSNKPGLQRKFLSQKDASFQNLRVVCAANEDLKTSTQEPSVLLRQSCARPHQSQNRLRVAKRKQKAKTCSSCEGLHP